VVALDRQPPQPGKNQLTTALVLPVSVVREIDDMAAFLPSVFVHGAAVCAPGLPDWPAAAVVLRGGAPYRSRPLPALGPVGLPANEQRRITPGIRLALHVAARAGAPVAAAGGGRLRAVFAASGGNAQSLEAVLSAVTAPGMAVSPRHFAQMDHNAAAGYWAIACGRDRPTVSVSLGAYDGSFAAGLLEAAAASLDDRLVMLVACDGPPPPPLQRCRAVTLAFAVAVLLGVDPPQSGGGAWSCRLVRGQADDRCTDPALERLRRDNPAARCLPLLRLLAAGGGGAVVLPYRPGVGVRVEQRPC
jgi:hypothetical protein